MTELRKKLHLILTDYENDSKAFLKKLRYLMRTKHAAEIMAARSDCEKIEKRILELNDYKKVAYADKLSGTITEEFFNSVMCSTDEESIRLKSEYDESRKILASVESSSMGSEYFCRKIALYSPDSVSDITEKLLADLIERIEIYERTDIPDAKKDMRLDFCFKGIGDII